MGPTKTNSCHAKNLEGEYEVLLSRDYIHNRTYLHYLSPQMWLLIIFFTSEERTTSLKKDSLCSWQI